ncbi:MAG: formate dehydrogenase accessory protein FdhE [Candidatus Rokuibacteriota bacterium]
MDQGDLLEEWRALLERRPSFRETLALCEPVLQAWAAWGEKSPPPLPWSAEECRVPWGKGEPLLARARPELRNEDLEPALGPALDALAATGIDGEALQTFAELWDTGAIGPRDLFPEPGRLGAGWLPARTRLSVESLGFLAVAGLRPALTRFFAACRPHLEPGLWGRSVCPFCGAPPAFAEIPEDGQRQLDCHACGGVWVFSRTRCPFCGTLAISQLIRLVPEGLQEEGYAITACKGCGGYLKELDRRVRWNAGSALVEDWGSPHFDLVARRGGYWRAVPVLVTVADPTVAD